LPPRSSDRKRDVQLGTLPSFLRSWSTAALNSFSNSQSSRIMSSACFRGSCVVRLFNVTVDASIRLCMSQFEDRPAPVLVQRATGHKRTETYGNSSPIIHRAFHVWKIKALKNAVRDFFCNIFARSKFVSQFLLWINAVDNLAKRAYCQPEDELALFFVSYRLEIYNRNVRELCPWPVADGCPHSASRVL